MPTNKVNNNIKLKSGGGVINDATDGLSVDTDIYPLTQTMPAYESLVAGDLLKAINDSGTYKLKKIVGLGAVSTGALAQVPSPMVFCFIATNKIAVLYAYNNSYYMQVGTISGTTITFAASATTVKSAYNVTAPTLSIKKVEDDKFLIAYPYDNGSNSASVFARAGTASGTAITLGTETEIYQTNNTVDLVVADLCEIDTNKFVLGYEFTGTNVFLRVITVEVSTDLSLGTQLSDWASGNDRHSRVIKLATDTFVVFYYNTNSYDTLYRVCTATGTTTITAGSAKTLIDLSDGLQIADSYHVLRVADNTGIIASVQTGTTTTLRLGYWTRSGDTLTLVGTTSIAAGVGAKFTQMTANLVLFDDFVYFYEKNVGFKKFAFDTSGNFVLLASYSGGANVNSNFLEARDTDVFVLRSISSSTPQFIQALLDHDEFITSANASYDTDDNVPVVSTFTGFSSLNNGLDYYINSAADGLTIDDTYQKVGKAINDTTIIK